MRLDSNAMRYDVKGGPERCCRVDGGCLDPFPFPAAWDVTIDRLLEWKQLSASEELEREF